MFFWHEGQLSVFRRLPVLPGALLAAVPGFLVKLVECRLLQADCLFQFRGA